MTRQIRWGRLAIWGLLMLLAGVLGLAVGARPAGAAGNVGGTCAQSDLEARLGGGGQVTFSCGAAPKTILFSHQEVISADTTIDGGGLITLSGGNGTRLFYIMAGQRLTLQNIQLEKGNSTCDYGGAVYNDGGTLILSHATIQQSQTGGPSGGASIGFCRATQLTDNSPREAHSSIPASPL